MSDTRIARGQAISKVNDEIIKRITSKKSHIFPSYFLSQYLNSTSIPQFKIEESLSQSGNTIISNWKRNAESPHQMQIPIDLFNDKLDFSCENFNDVQRLNEEMTKVLAKYTFLDPIRAAPEIDKFLNNFEVLQIFLGEIEEHLMQSEYLLSHYTQEITKINNSLLNLSIKGLQFTPPKPTNTNLINNIIFGKGIGTARSNREQSGFPASNVLTYAESGNRHWNSGVTDAASLYCTFQNASIITNITISIRCCARISIWGGDGFDQSCLLVGEQSTNLTDNDATNPKRILRWDIHQPNKKFSVVRIDCQTGGNVSLHWVVIHGYS
jgi:hypothetical protein